MSCKTVFILLFVTILSTSFQKNKIILTANDVKDTWTILLVDSNSYDISWDMDIQEASVYFLGKEFSDKIIKKNIIKINDIYKSEKKHVKETAKLYKKGLFSISLSDFFYVELEKQFPYRAGFYSDLPESENKFITLSKGTILKEFYFDGKTFISKQEAGKKGIKKYIIVKHYW